VGWLSELFHRAKQCGVVIGDGKFAFPVVATNHHQDFLTALTGGRAQASAHHYCAALLVPQPNNPYSKHAVAVQVRGLLIGHLPDDCSADFLTGLRHAGYHRAACEAIIVGRWDRGDNDQGSFGVRLNARMPFQFLSADQWQQLHNRA
jgi:hypothetical protein